jgi:uncharacterized metal-binding protein YceD (DUF177 family)
MNKRKSAACPEGAPVWSAPIPVADIPETGRRVDLAPDAATRAAVAAAAGVVALPRLEVSAEIFRHGRDGARAVGRVSATVDQQCVVTLEPMQSDVEETFDLLFAPPVAPDSWRGGGDDLAADAAADADTGEAPEVLRDGAVDLGAVATEFLILGIDPYPRKPGAAFEAPPADDPASHPFAALAALKKPG